VDRDNYALYDGWLHHELRLQRCEACAKWHHPPRPLCPYCWSFDVRPTAVRGRGTVHLATVLRQGRAIEGIAYPHALVAVDLEEQEGLRFSAIVSGSDPGDVQIGAAAQLVWIELQGAPWPAFELIDGEAPGSRIDAG
jgi:hypothetical protein